MSLATRAQGLQPELLLRWSIAVALATMGMKTLAWWLTGSVGLLSDALESGVNLAGALFALLMVKVAQRPADAGHPFGHHKAEYFSSGFEGLLIVLAGLAIVWAGVQRLLQPQALAQVGWGLSLTVASSALNAVLAWAMLQSARRHRSIALEADARHLVADVWTSAGVLVGVALAAATGWLWLDPLVAMLVAANILIEGGRLVWRSAQGLMDGALEPEVLARIEGVLREFGTPPLRIDHVASRRSGQRRFVELHLHAPASWSLGRAAAARGALEQALLRTVPGLRASIQLLPSDLEPEFDDEERG